MAYQNPFTSHAVPKNNYANQWSDVWDLYNADKWRDKEPPQVSPRGKKASVDLYQMTRLAARCSRIVKAMGEDPAALQTQIQTAEQMLSNAASVPPEQMDSQLQQLKQTLDNHLQGQNMPVTSASWIKLHRRVMTPYLLQGYFKRKKAHGEVGMGGMTDADDMPNMEGLEDLGHEEHEGEEEKELNTVDLSFGSEDDAAAAWDALLPSLEDVQEIAQEKGDSIKITGDDDAVDAVVNMIEDSGIEVMDVQGGDMPEHEEESVPEGGMREAFMRKKRAVAPPGWEGTVKKMKKHKDIDNPWALAWSMKNKGDKSHVKSSNVKTACSGQVMSWGSYKKSPKKQATTPKHRKISSMSDYQRKLSSLRIDAYLAAKYAGFESVAQALREAPNKAYASPPPADIVSLVRNKAAAKEAIQAFERWHKFASAQVAAVQKKTASSLEDDLEAALAS